MEVFLEAFSENNTKLSIRKARFNVSDSTESEIIKYLRKIIFKHDILFEFKSVLDSACSPEPFIVRSNVVKKVIKGLNSVLLSDEDVKAKVDVFRYVFQSFVSRCKDSENVCIVQFFFILSHIIGINNVNESSDCVINVENFKKEFGVETPLSSASFLMFKELLLCLSKTSVNMNSFDVQSYNKWLPNLIKNIANFKPFQNIFLEIFYAAAEVDIKLLEGNLDHIFSNIFAQEPSVNDNFSKAYSDFLEKALKISAQFQRTVKFITKFLSSVKATPTTLPKDIILPLNFINEFSTVVSFASNQQSLLFMDILTQNLHEGFNLILEEKSDSDLALLFITSELVISFLKNVKLFAPGIAVTTLQAFIDKMSSLKEILTKFGDILFGYVKKYFTSKNKTVVKTYLELCFYCGEVEMLINCYKDSILDPSDVKELEIDGDWQPCLNPEQWKILVDFALKSKLQFSDSYCFQLAMQKLRACKLQNKPLTEDCTVDIILNQFKSDKEEFNICQRLLPEDLNILLKSITAEQLEEVAKNILRQLLQNENQTETMIWLQDSAIQENEVFISSLFTQILKNTESLLRVAINEKHYPKIAWFCEEYFEDSGEAADSLPEKVNNLLKNGKKLRKFISDHEPFVNIIKVFKLLPLFCMKGGIQKLGMSYIVAMAVLLADDETAASLTFESIYNFLFSNLDASTCFHIGIFIKCLREFSYENERTESLKIKVIESLVRNCVNMKDGLSQMEEMIDSAHSLKLGTPIKTLESHVLLYNELGKCWQRAKKRQADNDMIGNCRTKLAKIISDKAKELPSLEINEENSSILLKIFSIELNKAVKSNDKNEIKDLIEQKFFSYHEFAVKKLKDEFDESSVMFLTVVLQSMPQLREFLPENFIFKIWKTLRNKEKVNWRLFCVNSTDEEFSRILKDLLKISEKFLHLKSKKYSSNFFEIWISFFDFATDSKKELCQRKLQEFFGLTAIYDSFLKNLSVKRKIYLMKFSSFCVTNKEVIVTSDVVDSIIGFILVPEGDSIPIEDFVNLFTLKVDVASSILVKQYAWAKSKIHLLYLAFQKLLGSLMKRCDDGEEMDKDDVLKLANCAFCMEKWASLMVKKEKDFARVSCYFISDLVSSMASVTLLPAIKIHLTNCVNHFLSISDSHTIAFLMRVLKPGYQQVFKTLYTQFNKFHKFTGKI